MNRGSSSKSLTWALCQGLLFGSYGEESYLQSLMVVFDAQQLSGVLSV